MKLSLLEQETILLYNQVEQNADVYTHDPKLMKKPGQLAEKYPDQIIKRDTHNFTVPKRCVMVWEPYSEERRKAARERAKANGYLPPVFIIIVGKKVNISIGISVEFCLQM